MLNNVVVRIGQTEMIAVQGVKTTDETLEWFNRIQRYVMIFHNDVLAWWDRENPDKNDFDAEWELFVRNITDNGQIPNYIVNLFYTMAQAIFRYVMHNGWTTDVRTFIRIVEAW